MIERGSILFQENDNIDSKKVMKFYQDFTNITGELEKLEEHLL